MLIELVRRTSRNEINGFGWRCERSTNYVRFCLTTFNSFPLLWKHCKHFRVNVVQTKCEINRNVMFGSRPSLFTFVATSETIAHVRVCVKPMPKIPSGLGNTKHVYSVAGMLWSCSCLFEHFSTYRRNYYCVGSFDSRRSIMSYAAIFTVVPF